MVSFNKRQFGVFLFVVILLFGTGFAVAVKPNPGHNWSEMDSKGTVLIADSTPTLGLPSLDVFRYNLDGGQSIARFKYNVGEVAMDIKSDGRVGIGTTTPEYKLDVAGAIRSTGTSTGIYFKDRTQSETDFAWYAVDNKARLWSTWGVDIITLVNSGNVGIGTSTPSANLKLDVDGQIGATKYCDENGGNCYTTSQMAGGDGADPLWARMLNDNDIHSTNTRNVGIGSNPDPSFPEQKLDVDGNIRARGDIMASGRVGIGTTLPNQKLHVSTGSDGWQARFGRSDASHIDISNNQIQSLYGDGSGGVLILQYSMGGNVGIGTNGPQAKLSVRSSDVLNTLFVENTGGGAGTQPALDVLMSAASSGRDIARFRNSNGAVMTINDYGRVGIGITPSEKLDVYGNIKISDPNGRLKLPANSCVVRPGTSSSDNAQAYCSAGEVITGGGGSCSDLNTNQVIVSYPQGNNGEEASLWFVRCKNSGGTTAYAICCKFK